MRWAKSVGACSFVNARPLLARVAAGFRSRSSRAPAAILPWPGRASQRRTESVTSTRTGIAITNTAIGVLNAPCARRMTSNVTTSPSRAARRAAANPVAAKGDAACPYEARNPQDWGHGQCHGDSKQHCPSHDHRAVRREDRPSSAHTPTAAHDSAARTKRSVFVRRSTRFRLRDYAALAVQIVLNGQ